MEDLKAQIDLGHLPKHVAIIMDGNGRWAKERGEDRLFGHFHGVQSVRDVVEAGAELGIRYLTLYAFSTENWDRPQAEVSGLMELLVNTIRKEVDQLKKNGIRLHVIGDLSMLPPNARQELSEALELTAENDHLHLIMALSYSGRWDIAQAFRSLAGKVQAGEINPDAVDAVRIAYWQRYGATLLGMMRHHAVRSDDFLRDAHQFENLSSMIRAERGVARVLKRLPGRKILLTNALHDGAVE